MIIAAVVVFLPRRTPVLRPTVGCSNRTIRDPSHSREPTAFCQLGKPVPHPMFVQNPKGYFSLSLPHVPTSIEEVQSLHDLLL